MLWPWHPTASVASSPAAAMPQGAPSAQATADPLMVMIAPLVVLVAFSYGRRHRRDGLPKGLVALVMMGGLGLAITSCIPIPTPTETPTPTPTPVPIPAVITTTTIDYTYDPLYRLIVQLDDWGLSNPV